MTQLRHGLLLAQLNRELSAGDKSLHTASLNLEIPPVFLQFLVCIVTKSQPLSAVILSNAKRLAKDLLALLLFNALDVKEYELCTLSSAFYPCSEICSLYIKKRSAEHLNSTLHSSNFTLFVYCMASWNASKNSGQAQVPQAITRSPLTAICSTMPLES